jgi:hypothetical protein
LRFRPDGKINRDAGGRRPRVSAIALIVLVLVAALLVAMLAAGARRSTIARSGAVDDDVHSFRSHAEASRSRRD